MKLQLIEVGFWQPEIKYKNPQSSKDNRGIQLNWLNCFNWPAYSEKEKRAYFKFCVIFTPDINAHQIFI